MAKKRVRDMSGASLQTLFRRVTYGGRKGRRALRRLGRHTVRELDDAFFALLKKTEEAKGNA